MKDLTCPTTGEVCPLKFVISERQQDLAGGIGNLCYRDAVKHGKLTGRLDSVGPEGETRQYTLAEDECSGPRRSLVIVGRQMCRASVVET